jgi:hypothetical protein
MKSTIDPATRVGTVTLSVADPRRSLAYYQHDIGLVLLYQRGVVWVSGEVESPATRTAVEALAGSVPHVRAVINRVEGADGAGAAENLRALFPTIGQEVYTSETRLGQVERVIIHPRHRRVTALVVRGWMMDPQETTASLSLDPDARQERLLVIPTSVVREVTEGAVLLQIGDDAAMRHADLEPAAYVPPATEWQPPYPYTHAEVLLELDRTPMLGERVSDVFESPVPDGLRVAMH